jgi:hypothetical protein
MPAALFLLSNGAVAVRCGCCTLLLHVCRQARLKIAKLAGPLPGFREWSTGVSAWRIATRKLPWPVTDVYAAMSESRMSVGACVAAHRQGRITGNQAAGDRRRHREDVSQSEIS